MRLPRLLILLLLAIAAVPLPAARAQSVLSETFAASNADLSPEARAGREIWMFATAFNDRFFTYTYPAAARAARSTGTGSCAPTVAASCSRPGARYPTPTAACRATRTARRARPPRPMASSGARATTTLLSFVGREGYRDPACDFEDAPFDTSTPHGARRPAPVACDLRFGTSTGRARLAQVPEPALRRGGLGEARRLGGLRGASCPTTRRARTAG